MQRRCRSGIASRLREGGDGICIFSAQGGLFLWIPLRFVFYQCAVSFRGDALKGAIDFAVDHVCDEASGGGRTDPKTGGTRLAFCGCDEKLAVDCFWGSEFAADA